MPEQENLQKTHLFEAHQNLDARVVDFSGWAMPVQYKSILAEWRAVRNSSGMFDVSHMGRLQIVGTGAGKLLSGVLSFDAENLRIGRAKYGFVFNEDAGIIDDCITYRLSDNSYLLIPNAANRSQVTNWLTRWKDPDSEVEIKDLTLETSMIAIQGPKAFEVVCNIYGRELGQLRPFTFKKGERNTKYRLIARTGYTGEDGFEIILANSDALGIWQAAVNLGCIPCGLGARDLLRLEAGLLLHGADINEQTTPFQAGLDRFVETGHHSQNPNVAAKALQKYINNPPTKNLIGFRLLGRGIPRPGFGILNGLEPIGEVTSGGYSPSLDTGIGLGYLPTAYSRPDTDIMIDIRGRRVEAQVASIPFYRRRKANDS